MDRGDQGAPSLSAEEAAGARKLEGMHGMNCIAAMILISQNRGMANSIRSYARVPVPVGCIREGRSLVN